MSETTKLGQLLDTLIEAAQSGVAQAPALVQELSQEATTQVIIEAKYQRSFSAMIGVAVLAAAAAFYHYTQLDTPGLAVLSIITGGASFFALCFFADATASLSKARASPKLTAIAQLKYVLK